MPLGLAMGEGCEPARIQESPKPWGFRVRVWSKTLKPNPKIETQKNFPARPQVTLLRYLRPLLGLSVAPWLLGLGMRV